MRRRPLQRVVEELLDLVHGRGLEILAPAGLGQHVAPGGEVVEPDAVLGEARRHLREDAGTCGKMP